MSESRRHNGYGVDLTGGPANLDMAFLALNSHADLLAALKAVLPLVECPCESQENQTCDTCILVGQCLAVIKKAEGAE